MEPNKDKFWYIHSCDLDANVQIKVGNLDGKRQRPSFEELLYDPLLLYSGKMNDAPALYVECQIYSNNRELTRPLRTSFKPNTKSMTWNEWLTLPYRICDLPRNSVLALTVYDAVAPRRSEIVGGTVVSFFGKRGVFREGIHDLKLWAGKKGCPEETPGKGSYKKGKHQMQRLTKLTKKYKEGQIPHVDWLDRLTYREIELVNEKEKRETDLMYLIVDFPKIEFDGFIYKVIYWELNAEVEYKHPTSAPLMKIQDPEMLLENLQENKHYRLARSLRHGHKDDKPNAAIRDELDRIMNYPPTKLLTGDEQDMVWRYRKHLSSKKKGLTKFLKCVNWKVQGEKDQALELMRAWVPPTVDDALELLGPSFTQVEVRSYAVERLSHATDEDLLLYLLQLVQAMKYDAWDSSNINQLLDDFHYSYGSNISDELGPTDMVIDHGLLNTQSTINQDDSNLHNSMSSLNSNESKVLDVGQRSMSSSISISQTKDDKANDEVDDAADDASKSDISCNANKPLDLASFLISRACKNPILANYLYWYLFVETEQTGKVSY